jgi:hypothetical protein
MSDPPPDDLDLSTLLDSLAAELDATAELAVSPAASPWLGEAAAVARDAAAAADEGADPETVAGRVAHVRSLLDGVDGTENDDADAHVAAASALADEAATRLPDPP